MKKILIVDDTEAIRTSFAMILEGFGHIELAYDGADAKILISRAIETNAPFDLVMTDTNMPRVGGVELVKWVKSISPDTPCILMSSGSDPQFHDADVFMGKLVNSGIVRETVDKLLSQNADTAPSVPRS